MSLKQFVFAAAMLALAVPVSAQGVFAPGDTVLGGKSDGTDFLFGVVGTVAATNNWPGAESPDKAIDGLGQKYLNFGETNTGILVTPSVAGTVAGGIKVWAANDAVERDPTGFEVWGTNAAISGDRVSLSLFSPIGSGPLSLPASRNAGGAAALNDVNAYSANFANSTSYSSYLVLFPDVKTPASANSMQIAEVQLTVVPEPSSALLALSLLAVAPLARRVRRQS